MGTNTADSVSINMDVFCDTNKVSMTTGDSVFMTTDTNNIATTTDTTNYCTNDTNDTNGAVLVDARDSQPLTIGGAGSMTSGRAAVDPEEIELIDMSGCLQGDSSQSWMSQKEEELSPKTQLSRPHLQPTQSPDGTGQCRDGRRSPSPAITISNHGSPRTSVVPNDEYVSSDSRHLLSPRKQLSRPGSPRKTRLTDDYSTCSLTVSCSAGRQVTETQPVDCLKAVPVHTCQHDDDKDDDDDDISMLSLLELLGAVRQYAKEIHEIYAPIKQDQEERIRKKNEQNVRRKSRDKSKNVVCRSNSDMAPPVKHEVHVEIHAPESTDIEDLRQQCNRRTKQQVLSQSKSQEPLATNQVASLHVENEKLASTWPRGSSHRAASRERFWSDIETSNQTSPKPPVPDSTVRPHVPASWSNKTAIRLERQVAEKTSHRPRKPGSETPITIGTKGQRIPQKLLAAGAQITNIRPAVHNQQPGRQAVYNQQPGRQAVHDQQPGRQAVHDQQPGRQAVHNQQPGRQAVPGISFIPASFKYNSSCAQSDTGVLPWSPTDMHISSISSSVPPADADSDRVIPPAPVVSSDHRLSRVVHGSNTAAGQAGQPSSFRGGLRKRKSVDQNMAATGLEQHVVTLDKY